MYMCACVCMYVRMYVCMYVCMPLTLPNFHVLREKKRECTRTQALRLKFRPAMATKSVPVRKFKPPLNMSQIQARIQGKSPVFRSILGSREAQIFRWQSSRQSWIFRPKFRSHGRIQIKLRNSDKPKKIQPKIKVNLARNPGENSGQTAEIQIHCGFHSSPGTQGT